MDAHPLFPVEEEGDTPAEVGWIQVTRFEGGRQVWGTHFFAPDELKSLDDVAIKFGGGTYELVARNVRQSRITARRRYVLSGAPIALDGSLTTVDTSAAPVAPPRAADSLAPLMLGILQMMTQQQQQSMQIVTSQQQQTMQLMATFMQSSKSEAATYAKLMSDSSREREKTMGDYFAKLTEIAKPNDAEAGFRWMELGMEMAAKTAAPEPTSDITDLMQGMAAFAAFNKGTPQGDKPS